MDLTKGAPWLLAEVCQANTMINDTGATRMMGAIVIQSTTQFAMMHECLNVGTSRNKRHLIVICDMRKVLLLTKSLLSRFARICLHMGWCYHSTPGDLGITELDTVGTHATDRAMAVLTGVLA